MAADYVAANDRERERLFALLDSMDGSDLACRLANGKTVAATLVHLAFWDDYAVALIGQWEAKGFSASQPDFAAVNRAIDAIAVATPMSDSPRHARQAAAAIDAKVQSLDHALAARALDAGLEMLLDRSRLRSMYVRQIESALRKTRTTCGAEA
jgi:hypothetical protein